MNSDELNKELQARVLEIWRILGGRPSLELARQIGLELVGLVERKKELEAVLAKIGPRSADEPEQSRFSGALHELRNTLGFIQQHGTRISQPAGYFFNRFVLPSIEERFEGDRYVTPRLLIDIMCRTIGVGIYDRVADLACGSGGFLAKPRRATYGADRDSDWLELAAINLILNGVKNVTLDPFGKAPVQKYNVLLMNPPRDKDRQARDVEFGLIQMGLHHLSQKGRAAILVSASLLSGPSGRGRKLFAEEDTQSLRAVVELPKSILQPYTTEPGLLVVMDRNLRALPPFIWFLRLADEGILPGGPPHGSDLPDPGSPLDVLSHLWRADSVVGPRAAEPVRVVPLGTRAKPAGYAIIPEPGLLVASVETLPSPKGSIHVVQLVGEGMEPFGWLAFTSTGQPSLDVSREVAIGRAAPDVVKPAQFERYSVEVEAGQPVALDQRGRVLGIGVARNRLRSNPDLRPTSHVLTHMTVEANLPPTTRELPTPAVLLARLEAAQHTIDGHIADLRKALVLSPTLGAPASTFRRPLGKLTDEQEKVWDRVCAQAGTGTARYFDAVDVSKTGDQRFVGQTLDLFRRMGMLVQVQVGGKPMYRIPTEAEMCFELTL